MQIELNGKLIDIPDYPSTHAHVYGDTGMGKSTFGATWPKPILVLSFDPHGKDMPYRKGAIEDRGLASYNINGMIIPYRDIIRKDGSVRIEYYHEEDPERPVAYSTFLQRMGVLHKEYDQWKTIIAESVTFMELCARKLHEKVLNPMTPFAKGTDTRQWFAGSTDLLEEMLIQRFGNLPMNLLVIGHIDERKNEVSGEILRGPFAPGRLSKRNLMGAAYQELYHAYRVRNDQGQLNWQLQTMSSEGFIATTQLGAPNPCYPHYLSLWENYGKGGA